MANLANGQVFPLPTGLEVELGERILAEMIPSTETSVQAKQLLAALEKDAMIVGVSDEVAQQLTLGQRELYRRQRRRSRARRN